MSDPSAPEAPDALSDDMTDRRRAGRTWAGCDRWMPREGHNVAWLALRPPTLVWLCPGWDVFQGQVAGHDGHGSERTMHRPSGVAADTAHPAVPVADAYQVPAAVLGHMPSRLTAGAGVLNSSSPCPIDCPLRAPLIS